MSKKTTDTKGSTTVKGYSADYKSIRGEVESKWPAWKVSTYNANFATSAHAKKVTTKQYGAWQTIFAFKKLLTGYRLYTRSGITNLTTLVYRIIAHYQTIMSNNIFSDTLINHPI